MIYTNRAWIPKIFVECTKNEYIRAKKNVSYIQVINIIYGPQFTRVLSIIVWDRILHVSA